ncbi:hypothetical protein DYBT9623_00945 [Dyadobacter sp. CECT 9623]|uniref:Carboxypeptidase regulatory-like domain-containing protein n=1 Tax=Dyadobacter linearis TaxID=2823330 RepID=A0ABM8UL77_9BACT|nr:hypothetical protein [Dyadobacter sp. CECT 9623]CAG5068216.1 hypothetical protein DYBT9623_00945 [Dyadobacter sp. CECT 9623]
MTRFNRILFLINLVSLSGCGVFTDRTTVVYGTITDQNGEPVDSILVSIDGVKGFRYETLKQVSPNNVGSYELLVEVPKKFSSVNIIVDTSPVENVGVERPYKKLLVKKNDKSTNNCCSASIGEKTKYDFQLIPK